ncbi:hypothetical protein ES702_05096 [subsurface metagenome]
MTPDELIEEAVRLVSKRPCDYYCPQFLCAIDGRLLVVPRHDQPPKDIRICSIKYNHNETGFAPERRIRLANRIRLLHEKGLLK